MLIEQPEDEIWVRNDIGVDRLAERIIAKLDDDIRVDVAGVGAGAVNQAVKALAVCRRLLNPGGFDLLVMPYFETFEDSGGNNRTRLVLRVVKFKLEQ